MKGFLLASLALAPLLVAAKEAAECTLVDSTGYYDLRKLQKKDDYAVRNYDNDETYYLNFCGPITHATWAVASPATIGGYYEGGHGGVSLGRYNTTLSRTSGALAFTYTQGSVCPNTSNQRGSIINLQCDKSWGRPSGPVLVGIIDECFYAFNFATPHACPISFISRVGSFLWSILSFTVIALCIAFAAYFAWSRIHGGGGSNQFSSASFGSSSKIGETLEFVKDIAGISAIYIFDFLKTVSAPVIAFLRRQPSGYSHVDYNSGAWSRNAASSFQRVPTEAPPPPPKKDGDVNVGVDILGDDEEEEGSEVEGEGPGKTHQPFKDDVEVV